MGKGMLIEVIQARLQKTSGDGKNFLYPEIRLEKSFVKPGWTMPDAPTLEGVAALALKEAIRVDNNQGQTFVADSGEPAYQSSGPWNFSAAAHERHGVIKKD